MPNSNESLFPQGLPKARSLSFPYKKQFAIPTFQAANQGCKSSRLLLLQFFNPTAGSANKGCKSSLLLLLQFFNPTAGSANKGSLRASPAPSGRARHAFTQPLKPQIKALCGLRPPLRGGLAINVPLRLFR